MREFPASKDKNDQTKSKGSSYLKCCGTKKQLSSSKTPCLMRSLLSSCLAFLLMYEIVLMQLSWLKHKLFRIVRILLFSCLLDIESSPAKRQHRCTALSSERIYDASCTLSTNTHIAIKNRQEILFLVKYLKIDGTDI